MACLDDGHATAMRRNRTFDFWLTYLGVTLDDGSLDFKEHLTSLCEGQDPEQHHSQAYWNYLECQRSNISDNRAIPSLLLCRVLLSVVAKQHPYYRGNAQLNHTMRLIRGCLKPTPTHWLPEPVPSATDADVTDSAQPPSRISAEWSGMTGGPPAEVVLRLHPPQTTLRSNVSSMSNSSETTNGSGVVVRAEEALIVAFVLLLWVAAIALFFNRWGKIRMLEPYQPKFQQQHRQSCALAENSVSVAPHHRASLSRGCVSYDCGVGFPAYQPCGYLPHRLRQNSVFVGSMGGMALIPESPPRRSRSAADLPALVPPSSDHPHATPRSSRAASLHSAVDLRISVPSPRASRAASLHSSVDMPSVQVHIRGSGGNLNKPRSPRRLTITNV
ncbi:uncharacterized protein LOC125230415 [Leguminivora glycinivorella]|uniref:uncharacterized protein LOC125230415 n=1 Tax=Leguminivora glycinivorella TaxID=1035111 RepID=UPI00200E0E3A|nr:uncharacterized protein LOC125230415 [Leguminivora glycinivorella]